jgi:eukaryotic-like serine/threonine-protein kinase
VEHKVDSGGIHGIALQIAAMRHDEKEVAHQIAWSRGTVNEGPILQQAAYAALADGRVHASEDLFDEATNAAKRDHMESDLEGNDNYRPRMLMEMGLLPQARELLGTLKTEDPYMDRLFAAAEIGDPAQAKAVAMRLQAESPQDTLVNVEYAPSIYAAVALRAGKPNEAVAAMRDAEQYELRDPTIAYLRGQAFLAAKMGAAAEVEFRRLIDNPGIEDPLSPLHALAHLNLARSLALEKHPAEARAEYVKFLAIWSTADSDLAPLKQAQGEMQRLPAQQ